MATNYPGGLDSLTNPSAGGALTSPSHAGQHTNANDAIEAIETELGTDPSGGSATVKARFEVIEANNWVTAARIAADAVGSSEIAADAVGSSELANNAVDTAAVADSAITTAKIADGAVTSAKIADGIKLAASGGDGVYLSTLTWPQIAAHRLGTNHYGENTMASARMCLAAGITVLECDFRRTSDGELVLMHDSTIDRTTDGTGTVSAMTGAQVAAARVDVYRTDGRTFSGYVPQRIPTLQEVALQVRGSAILVAEDKNLSLAQIPAAAAGLRQAGLTDTIIVQSASTDSCEAWAAEGFTSMYTTTVTLSDPAATKASGIDWVSYSWMSDGARVAAAQAAGLRVATWTHTQWAGTGGTQAALDAGVDMPMSDSPGIGLGNRWLDFTFTPPAPPPGVLPVAGSTWVIDNGGLLRCTSGGGSEPYADLYCLGPTSGSSVTFDLIWRHVGATISDTSRWGSLYIGTTGSGYKNATDTGYHILSRPNGTVNIYRWNGSATTSIATATGTALAGDTDHTLTITVTPTTITAVNSAGTTATVSDATYRPAGGWWPSWARATLPEIGVRSVSWRV